VDGFNNKNIFLSDSAAFYKSCKSAVIFVNAGPHNAGDLLEQGSAAFNNAWNKIAENLAVKRGYKTGYYTCKENEVSLVAGYTNQGTGVAVYIVRCCPNALCGSKKQWVIGARSDGTIFGKCCKSGQKVEESSSGITCKK